MDIATPVEQTVCFSLRWEAGRLLQVTTNSPEVNHFLNYIKMTHAYHTWVNYAHDLKLFFTIIDKPPSGITRSDCLDFMRQQVQAGHTNATINRRLAAVSSLFNELHLLDSRQFSHNPVFPRQGASNQPGQSLYRKQPQRIPQVVTPEELQAFFEILPTWRDRTLVLLMWLSCLRLSEAVGIRFQDIECSRRSIYIPDGKGGLARTVFMDSATFAVLNLYLDEERKDLFPDVDSLFVAFKGKARGRPLSINAVQKMLGYYSNRLGLSHLHAHLFRHTGITQLVQQGMAEPAIRQLVGHRRPESLLPYLHLDDDFVAQEFAKAQAGLVAATWLVEGGES